MRQTRGRLVADLLFHVLWQRHLDGLKAGRLPDDFPALPLKELIRSLERETGEPVNDELTVRRAINRLQTDVEEAVKKQLGLPIGREDIVQTRRKSAQADSENGYRINPATVLARPYQGEVSPES